MFSRSQSYRTLGYRYAAFLIIALLAGLIFWLVFSTERFKIFPFSLEPGEEMANLNNGQYYVDLELDGRAEILVFKKYSEQAVIEVFAHGEQFIDVIRCRGDLLDERPSYHVCDTDDDGQAELYVLTVKNDSILLNGYQVMGGKRHFLVDHFLSSYTMPQNNRNNIGLVGIESADLDNNGHKELIFALRAGFSLQPRQIFVVEPATGITHRSEKSAAAFDYLSLFPDSIGSRSYLVAGSSAVENYEPDDTILFNDHSGWLILYNRDLSERILVREYPENKSMIFPVMKRIDGQLYCYVLVKEVSTRKSYLEKMTVDGDLVERVLVTSNLYSQKFLNWFTRDLEMPVILSADTLFWYDTDLELVRKEPGAGELMINDDGLFIHSFRKSGLLPFLRKDRLVLRDRSLEKVAVCRLKEIQLNSRDHFTVKTYLPAERTEICFSREGHNLSFHFTLTENWYYPFRGVIYVLFYLAVFLFLYGIFRLQVYFYSRRFINEQKISELQLQTVQNQLQPHFTFNVLNTIGAMIYRDRKEEAYRYLNSFSDILRSVLISRSSAEWSLREELRFINTYVEMENLRFDNKFTYLPSIESEPDLNRLVPKLAVQSVVENAIQHGLLHREGPCILELSVCREGDHMRIMVEDNGIGRKAAAGLQRSKTGLGNQIFSDFMEVYNRTSRIKFKMITEDLYAGNGDPSGTRVVLFVPADFRTEHQRL